MLFDGCCGLGLFVKGEKPAKREKLKENIMCPPYLLSLLTRLSKLLTVESSNQPTPVVLISHSF